MIVVTRSCETDSDNYGRSVWTWKVEIRRKRDEPVEGKIPWIVRSVPDTRH
jgi:hypothetical protein